MAESQGEIPDLFEAAKAYERPYPGSGNVFTWSQGESLEELERPERANAIRKDAERRRLSRAVTRSDLTLAEVYAERIAPQANDEDDACVICTV